MEKVTVIGAGTMGHGIAQVAAAAGYNVVICDQHQGALSKAVARIDKNLAGAVARKKMTAAEHEATKQRIVASHDLSRAALNATLVIEAIVENLTVKHDVLSTVCGVVTDDCIVASNTSSIPLTKIAEALPKPERVIGMHFFNPVHIMKLLEVVVHPATSDATLDRTLSFSRAFGKEPIVVNDSPGFASSRLGVMLGLEAMRMVEEGVASAEDIDKAMTLGYKHPMGPLRLTDVVGLDVRLAIAETLQRELASDRYAPPKILRDKVAAGELGKKSGKGFYEWSQG